MACFTLTSEQTQMIVDLMQVGYEGAEFDNDEDNEAIAAFMDELGSATGPIEITVMRIENDADFSDDLLDDPTDEEIAEQQERWDRDNPPVGYSEITGEMIYDNEGLIVTA